MSTEQQTITVSAVVLLRQNTATHQHDVALVRKQGTRMFMFPGGKHEPGETPADAGARELHEETGVQISAAALQHRGVWHTDTANEPGWQLHSEVFTVPASAWAGQQAVARAEIAELIWVDPRSQDLSRVLPVGTSLAPLVPAVFDMLY